MDPPWPPNEVLRILQNVQKNPEKKLGGIHGTILSIKS